MKVCNLMTSEVFVVNRREPILKAEAVMKWARTRHVPVVDSTSKVVGLITHRDILAASTAIISRIPADRADEDLAGIPLESVMQTKVICVDPDADLATAAKLMQDNQIGCLPVTTNRRLMGIVTEADFVTLARNCPADETVDSIMSRNLWTADTKNNVFYIDQLMQWARIRHVPYVDEDRHLVGIISHRDLLRTCLSTLVSAHSRSRAAHLRRINVDDIATRDPHTTTPKSRIRDVAQIMLEEKIGALPVLENDKLIGIITEADLVKKVSNSLPRSNHHQTVSDSAFKSHRPVAWPPRSI